MNLGLLFLIEFIVVIILEIIFENIRNFRFYYYIVNKNKYFFYERMKKREKWAYRITKIVCRIPEISFAPLSYEYDMADREAEYATDKKGKRIAIWYALRLRLRFICDLAVKVLVLTLCIEGWNDFVSICKKACLLFRSIDFSGINEVVKWVNNNIAFVLIIILIVVSLYYFRLKKRKLKFEMEKVWESSEKEKIKEIADIQKRLECELKDIRIKIYDNINFCRKLAHLSKNNEVNVARLEELKSYEEQASNIKSLLIKLVEIDAWTIWGKRNRDIYIQFALLGLLPSITKTYGYVEIERCDKKYIIEDYNSTKDFINTWSYGVSLVNGIERVLNFSNKRYRSYKKLLSRLQGIEVIKELKEDIGRIKK